jgi:arylsulfatase A-like enzyme
MRSLAILLLAACACSAEYEARTHLAARLPQAELVDAQAHGTTSLSAQWQDLGADRRLAIYQHPPAAFRFPAIPTRERAFLHLAPALAPGAVAGGSDGVRFEVACRGANGERSLLLAFDLLPVTPEAVAAWNDHAIPLEACSAPTTELELRTRCGPAHCSLDWALWGNPHVRWRRSVERRRAPVALLVSIDTLRPDRLDVYGAERVTAPHLADLARDGIVFERAVAPSPWTVPSHASLFTGVEPQVHGADGQRDLPAALPTLAEVLAAAGWETAGFADSTWFARSGFSRGFGVFEALFRAHELPRRGVDLTRESVVDWLDQPARGPAFVFWHVMDVHGPYGARAPFAGRFRSTVSPGSEGRPPIGSLGELGYHDHLLLDRFASVEELVAAYDEGIALADAELGALFDFLRTAGVYDDALIVVTSDHGESLLDRGLWVGHGLTLYEPELRIPLLVKLPRNRFAGRRVETPVRLIDVGPTLLDALGIPPPATFQGTSLLPRVAGEEEAAPPLAVALSTNTGAVAIRAGGYKYISAWAEPAEKVAAAHLFPRDPEALLARLEVGERLYDLERDPDERTNLAASPEHQSAGGRKGPPERLESARGYGARTSSANKARGE